jgi:8-oxo-dGTP pyrophosphatase MutT (NUDIX family)
MFKSIAEESLTPRARQEPVIQYEGRIFRIVKQEMEFPGGKIVSFESAERSPGVRLIVTDGKKILLTREWRAEIDGWDYRLPGGKVFEDFASFDKVRNDLSALENACRLAGARELEEETGISVEAGALRAVHTSVCGATVAWDLHYYVAVTPTIDDHENPQVTDEGEVIGYRFFTSEEIGRIFSSGMISEERSAATLLRILLMSGAADLGLPAGLTLSLGWQEACTDQ